MSLIKSDLFSCDNCAVVLDKSKIEFPEYYWTMDGAIDYDKAGWNGEEYVAKVKCPVCGADILESDC